MSHRVTAALQCVKATHTDVHTDLHKDVIYTNSSDLLAQHQWLTAVSVSRVFNLTCIDRFTSNIQIQQIHYKQGKKQHSVASNYSLCLIIYVFEKV